MKDQLMPVLEKYWEDFWILLPKIVLALGLLIVAAIFAKKGKKNSAEKNEQEVG